VRKPEDVGSPAVARCRGGAVPVERLMRINGWCGATRAKRIRTTIPAPAATRAPDLVNRQSSVEAPNRLLVADFTYVRTLAGFLLHGLCDRRLRRADRGLGMLNQQAHRVRRTSHHPSRRIPRQTGKPPAKQDDSPLRRPICFCALHRDPASPRDKPVDRYNTSWLTHRLDRRPPAEAEADYHARNRDDQPVAHSHNRRCIKPGALQPPMPHFRTHSQTARTSASRLTAYSSSQQTAASHAADACAAMSCAPSSRPAALWGSTRSRSGTSTCDSSQSISAT
jgi:hypothetical protein